MLKAHAEVLYEPDGSDREDTEGGEA
jgi:hypothetical protein